MRNFYVFFVLIFSFFLSATSVQADLVDPGLINPLDPSNPIDWKSVLISGGVVVLVVVVSILVLNRIKNKKNVPNK